MRKVILGATLALAMALGAIGGGVNAAPIDCTPGQTAVKLADGWWSCQNNGGNLNQSGDSNNPNGHPHFHR